MKQQKLISLAEVIDLPPGSKGKNTFINNPFDAVVVVTVKEYKGNVSQKCELVQASNEDIRIAAKFWGDRDVSSLDGKLVRFSGKGLARTAYSNPHNGKVTQQVSISEDATLEVIGVSAHPDKPLPHKASPHRDTPLTQQNASVSQETVFPVTDTLRRSKCYFGVLFDVEAAYLGAKEAGLKTELTPGDLKDIATHISMTYRGQYGSYMEPIFPKRGAGTAKEELSKLPEQEWEGDQPTLAKPAAKAKPAINSSWRDIMHPKRGVPLSELSESDQLGLVRWALSQASPPTKDSARQLYANVMLMAGEKDWASPANCFLASVEQVEATEEGWDKAAIARFGVAMSLFDDTQLTDAIKNFDALAQEAVVKSSEEQGEDDNDGVPY